MVFSVAMKFWIGLTVVPTNDRSVVLASIERASSALVWIWYGFTVNNALYWSIRITWMTSTLYWNQFLQKWYRICFRFKFKIRHLNVVWKRGGVRIKTCYHTHNLDTSDIDTGLTVQASGPRTIITFFISRRIKNFAIIRYIFYTKILHN